jgi:outer membrane protein assembly factor BamE
MRILLLGLLVVSLSACQLLYRLPTRQGNLLDQRDLKKLEVGMSREQVKFVLGAPVAGNPFRDDRWDYVSYYKSPRGEVSTKTVTVYFDNDRVTKLDGVQTAMAAPSDSGSELKAGQEEDKKLQLEGRGSRPDAGETGASTPPTPGGAP